MLASHCAGPRRVPGRAAHPHVSGGVIGIRNEHGKQKYLQSHQTFALHVMHRSRGTGDRGPLPQSSMSSPIEESALWLPATSCAEEYSPTLAACPAALAACSCTSSCACLFEALAACPCAKECSLTLAACPKALAASPRAKEIRMLPLSFGFLQNTLTQTLRMDLLCRCSPH